MLMGVRLYVPAIGRFLQVDPIPGGSANDYDYANQDPINAYDLDGRWGFRRWWHRTYETWYKRAVDVVAVPPYAAYYGAYRARRWIAHRHRRFLRATGWLYHVERWGLHTDIRLDRYKNRRFHNHERDNDEGIRGHILPRWLFHGGPRTYLPGWHYRDRRRIDLI